MTLYTANGHKAIRALDWTTARHEIPAICSVEEMRRDDGFACYVVDNGHEVGDADCYETLDKEQVVVQRKTETEQEQP